MLALGAVGVLALVSTARASACAALPSEIQFDKNECWQLCKKTPIDVSSGVSTKSYLSFTVSNTPKVAYVVSPEDPTAKGPLGWTQMYDYQDAYEDKVFSCHIADSTDNYGCTVRSLSNTWKYLKTGNSGANKKVYFSLNKCDGVPDQRLVLDVFVQSNGTCADVKVESSPSPTCTESGAERTGPALLLAALLAFLTVASLF